MQTCKPTLPLPLPFTEANPSPRPAQALPRVSRRGPKYVSPKWFTQRKQGARSSLPTAAHVARGQAGLGLGVGRGAQ